LQRRSVAATEREGDQVLQLVQDAELGVTTLEEVVPAIRAFRDKLESLQSRRGDLDLLLEVKEGLISDHEDDPKSKRQERQSNREEKQALLREVNATSIAEYRDRVETQETLKGKCE
jgi:hypothetical protein